MSIKWNEVTWYSKLGAVILFLLVVPTLTFFIGRAYESAVEVVASPVLEAPVRVATARPVVAGTSLSDADIEQALLAMPAESDMKLSKNLDPKVPADYTFFDGHGGLKINRVARGDLNGDGLEDAAIEATWCAGSCGGNFIFVVGSTSTPVAATSRGPDDIVLSGYLQAQVDSLAISDGVLTVVSVAGEATSTGRYRLEFAAPATATSSAEYRFVRARP